MKFKYGFSFFSNWIKTRYESRFYCQRLYWKYAQRGPRQKSSYCWQRHPWYYFTFIFLEIISLVYSRTNILQKEVFFIEKIDNLRNEKLTHLKSIYFLRCTEDNLNRIVQELQEPKFSSYNLCKSLFNPIQIFQILLVMKKFKD